MLRTARESKSLGGEAWVVFRAALARFLEADGSQWAGAFAYYAFFSLFPLIVLAVTVASVFVEREKASNEIIHFIETFVPIGPERQQQIFDTIARVISTRGQASIVASLILTWAVIRCVSTLIRAINRVWGGDRHNWWRLSLKGLVLLVLLIVVVLLGLLFPILIKLGKVWLIPSNDLIPWIYASGNFLIPLSVIFLTLCLSYKVAPRREVRFAEVWLAAVCATAMLKGAESLFVVYLKNFASFNAVYGAFGSIMALLLWIYLSGSIFIFGACICAAQAERRLHSS